MITKIITLPTNDSKIYKQILAFLNFMLELTNQEREVLSELIKLNHEYIALPPEKRAKFILSTDMRKETREVLKMEEKHFNGVIGRLKKKGFLGKPILSEKNVVHPELLFKPDDDGFRIEITLDKQVKKAASPPAAPSPKKQAPPTPPGRPEDTQEEEVSISITPPTS